MCDQQMRQRTIVDIRSRNDAGRGDRLVRITPLDDQRRPVADLLAVLAVFHAVIAMMRRHRLVACAQKIDILPPLTKLMCGHGMDEGAGIGDRTLPDEESPKLARQVKLRIDLKRSGNIDAAV